MRSISSTQQESDDAVSEVIHGACLCDEVAFEVQPSYQFGPGLAMGMCHCTRCQRWSGAGGAPFVVVAPSRFKVTRGREFQAHYRGEGFAVRTFCRRCGSSLYTDSGTTYYVSAGVLYDLKLTPAFHIQVAHKAAWDEIAGNAPQFPGLPSAPMHSTKETG
jgi:hypothetical protein